MSKLILDDLSALIEPLLPPPKPRRVRYPGRKPLDNRAVLTGILFVLQTGLRWDPLPREMGCGSGMSCCLVCVTGRPPASRSGCMRCCLRDCAQPTITEIARRDQPHGSGLGKTLSPPSHSIRAPRFHPRGLHENRLLHHMLRHLQNSFC
jgi:transposase